MTLPKARTAESEESNANRETGGAETTMTASPGIESGACRSAGNLNARSGTQASQLCDLGLCR